jgi:hypothetical protein
MVSFLYSILAGFEFRFFSPPIFSHYKIRVMAVIVSEENQEMTRPVWISLLMVNPNNLSFFISGIG